MSPQGETSSSSQIRKCSRRTRRLCKPQLVTQECSKISQVLRPPDGQLGPCCLLKDDLPMGQGCVLAEQKGNRTGVLRAKRNRRATKVLLINWSDFCLMTLQLQSAPGLHFQHKNHVFKKVSLKIIKKLSAHDAARALHEEYLLTVSPSLGRFHLELPKYLSSFLRCGKKVLWPKKLSFPTSQIYRFREHGFSVTPQNRAAGVCENPWGPTTKSLFQGHTNICWRNVRRRKVQCPNSDLSKPQ